MNDPKKAASLGSGPAVPRRPYKRPELVLYGSVRQVTFGSVGTFADSGGTKRTTKKTKSDPLAKCDIVRVGTHPLGIGLYLYRYRPAFAQQYGSGRHFGVMADEVEQVLPAAVTRDASGMRMVDHELLGIRDLGRSTDS